MSIASMLKTTAGTGEEIFTLDEGRVTINFPARMSGASREDLKAYLDIFYRKACRLSDDPVDAVDPKYFNKENWQLPGGMQNKLHLLARRIAVPHPRGGVIDVSAPLPPHMQQSWNLLGFDAARYDPIEEAPEEE